MRCGVPTKGSIGECLQPRPCSKHGTTIGGAGEKEITPGRNPAVPGLTPGRPTIILPEAQADVRRPYTAEGAGANPAGQTNLLKCSWCGKMVDPEGHRWECTGTGPIEQKASSADFQSANPGSNPGGATITLHGILTTPSGETMEADVTFEVAKMGGLFKIKTFGPVADLADAADLKSVPEKGEGSNPSGATTRRQRRAKVGDVVRVKGKRGRWSVEKVDDGVYTLHGEYRKGGYMTAKRDEFKALHKRNALNFAKPPSIPPNTKGR